MICENIRLTFNPGHIRTRQLCQMLQGSLQTVTDPGPNISDTVNYPVVPSWAFSINHFHMPFESLHLNLFV